MKETKSTFEYKGKTYSLVFNLNVMEQIQDEYGTIDKWASLTDNEEEVNVKALLFGFTCMINEGIDIDNDDREEKEPFLTKKQVGRMITDLGTASSLNKMQDTVTQSVTTEESKNV